MFPIAVLIAAPELQAALKERLSGETLELLVFGDTEVLKALEVITSKHPSLVIIERGFSTTPRGVALIRRLKADPALEPTMIQVESADAAVASPSIETVATTDVNAAAETADTIEIVQTIEPIAAIAAAVPAPESAVERPAALDSGTRRAPRVSPDDSFEVTVDGTRATLLDISTVGARLLTSVAVRPNQRVRVSFADKAGTIRCSATVVWASFEIPKDAGPRYRVGVDFVNPETAKLDVFIARHART